jgi:hypothetical protein
LALLGALFPVDDAPAPELAAVWEEPDPLALDEVGLDPPDVVPLELGAPEALAVDPVEVGVTEPLPVLPPCPAPVLEPDDEEEELRSLASAVSALATAVSSC